MAKKFNPSQPRRYFTAGFLKNHIRVGEGAKKAAEKVSMRRNNPADENVRGIEVSTVIELKQSELVKLAREVFEHQEEYAVRPRAEYTSKMVLQHWGRGVQKGTVDGRRVVVTRGKSSAKKRAILKKGKLHYGVRLCPNTNIYQINHYGGIR